MPEALEWCAREPYAVDYACMHKFIGEYGVIFCGESLHHAGIGMIAAVEE